ncbi:MAG TPA: pectinesterase family protein [Humisphaera sp.]
MERTLVVTAILFVVLAARPSSARTVTVDAGGGGDFKTVQEAVAAVPDGAAERTVIRIRPGTYEGPVVVAKAKAKVTFEGEDAERTVLTYGYNINEENPPPAVRRYWGIGVVVLADDFRAERVTFRNTSGDHGQALALRIDGDRAALRHCRLLGWQDTLRVEAGRQYFVDCYVEGRVDFIYGSGTAVFDRCTVHSKNGGYVTAASTPADRPFGFVFLRCKLTGDATPWTPPAGLPPGASDTKPPRPGKAAYLGRPWRPHASVTFVDCEMGDHVRPEGWDNWGKASNEQTARYAEHNSTGPGANPAKRVAWSRQMGKDEAAKISVRAVLGGGDGWDAEAWGRERRPDEPRAGTK